MGGEKRNLPRRLRRCIWGGREAKDFAVLWDKYSQEEEITNKFKFVLVQRKLEHNWLLDLVIGNSLITLVRAAFVQWWGWKPHRGEIRRQLEEGSVEGSLTCFSPVLCRHAMSIKFICISQTSLCLVSLKKPH